MLHCNSIFMSSKSMSQIFKILFQTRDINIFVLRGVFFSRYIQLRSSFSDEKDISCEIWGHVHIISYRFLFRFTKLCGMMWTHFQTMFTLYCIAVRSVTKCISDRVFAHTWSKYLSALFISDSSRDATLF